MIQHWQRPIVAFGLLVALSSGACSDEADPSNDTGVTDLGDDGSEDLTDTGEDTTQDVAADAVPDQADQGSETGTDAGADADVNDEPDLGVCPGSISCFDDEFDRPRTAICIQEGFPTGTSCPLISEGLACCVPPFACETDDDCEAAREAEGFCSDDRYACTCNVTDGTCSSFICATDDECEEDTICRSGSCVEEGSREGLVARIVSPGGVIFEGETRTLVAVAVDPEDPTRVFDDVAITWSSDEVGRVSIGETTGVIVGEAEAGEAIITARVADNEEDPGSSVTIVNYEETDAPVRVVVISEDQRMPVSGAQVVFEFGDAGFRVTGADGVAELSEDPGAYYVHVTHPDYGYVSFVGLDSETTSDLLVSLPPNAFVEVVPESELDEGSDLPCQEIDGETLCYDLEGVGAVVGYPDFEVVANEGEVDVAITGFGLGNSLLDLNFEIIVGPNIKRDLSDGPIPVDDLAEIPGGVTMAFNRDPFVPTYVATALPGERTIWSLGGRVSLSENPNLLPDILEQIDGDIELGQIIAVILPLFQDFYSGIETGLEVELAEEGELSLSRFDTRLDVPMARRVFVDAPTIPSSEQRPLETGIFLAGAMVPGQGFIPLGITAAVDDADGTPADGVLDGDTETSTVIDPLPMNLAPIHGGIESPLTEYLIVAVALGLRDPPGDQPNRENTAGTILRVPAGEFLPSEVTFPNASFPEVAEGSTYDPETRTVTITPPAGDAPDFYRLLFKSERGRIWQIHVPPTLTSVPVADLESLLGAEDRAAGERPSVLSLYLVSEGDGAADYDELMSPTGPNFLDIVRYVDQFSVYEIR
jgi:hypothetical protein